MPADAPTAFFSYSRDDSEFTLRLAEDLKAAGAHVWLDQLDIEPGQRWARAVQDALNNSPRVLVILSPSSVDSTHVEDEVNFALEEHKTVIPVLYQDCKVPFQLRPFQYVDFRTDYARGIKVMLKTLGVEQQTAVGAAAGSVAPVESQPVAPDVAEQVRLEEERKQAAEQARLEERRKQEEQARLHEAHMQAAEKWGIVQSLKEAAEHARLEQERKLTAEQAQRAQEEAERQRAAEKSRREREERERQQATPPASLISRWQLWVAVGVVASIVGITLLIRSGSSKPVQTVQQSTSSGPGAASSPQPNQHAPSSDESNSKLAPTPSETRPKQTEVTSESKRPVKPPNWPSTKPSASPSTAVSPSDKDAPVTQPRTESLSPWAMNEKGDDYYNGRNSVSKDYQQAVSWYRKAADAGDSYGMFNLGFMYQHGYGVTQDYQQAISWYRKAADAGNNYGMLYMGIMYENGYGMGKDSQQAISWYRKAAQLGNQFAKDNLKRLGESP